MFKDYLSKPITRKAHKIVEGDNITKVSGAEATYVLESSDQLIVIFKAYEDTKVGDYIIYLKDDDIYHCSAEVFADRNIIPTGD